MCGHLSWCAEAKSMNRRKQAQTSCHPPLESRYFLNAFQPLAPETIGRTDCSALSSSLWISRTLFNLVVSSSRILWLPLSNKLATTCRSMMLPSPAVTLPCASTTDTLPTSRQAVCARPALCRATRPAPCPPHPFSLFARWQNGI